MENTIQSIKKIRTDSTYGKKKHFNAADRLQKRHYWIGVPLVILNIITGSILFYLITDSVSTWAKVISAMFALIAALLSGFQTYFNLPQKIEGNRIVANKYLAIMKKCDRLLAYIQDGSIDNSDVINRIEQLSLDADKVNNEALVYPTTARDYKKAQAGIIKGEEAYTESELNLG